MKKKIRNVVVGFVMVVPFFLGACTCMIVAAVWSGYCLMAEKLDQWSDEP